MKPHIITLLSAVGFCAAPAFADGMTLVADLDLASAVHDRGEQLGDESLQAGIAIEFDDGFYAGVYRLTPFGDDQAGFDHEVDYFFGYAFEVGGVGIDLSANYLTYPGEAGEATMELVSVFVFDAPLNPEMMVFFDADTEDYGAELLLAHEIELSAQWLGAASFYGGFVEPGDGSANRSYIGAQLTAARPISEMAEFYVYSRVDAADEPSFLDGDSSGVAIGMGVSFAFG